jgi:hypothetical protein
MSATSTFIIHRRGVLNTTQASYPACTNVYYRIRLYNSSYSLVNANFSLNIKDGTGANVYYNLLLSPNNGTGTYTSYHGASITDNPGTWFIIAASGSAAGAHPFTVQ